MRCIFSYTEFSAFGNIEDYDGFRIDIMNNATIYYKTINIDEKVKCIKKYRTSNLSVKQIQNLISKNKKIFKFYDDLDNGTLDGTGHKFSFFSNKKKKEIVAWNIELSKEINLIYLILLFPICIFNKDIREVYQNIKQQKFLLKVFYKISDILKKDGYVLELYKFKRVNSKRRKIYYRTKKRSNNNERNKKWNNRFSNR